MTRLASNVLMMLAVLAELPRRRQEPGPSDMEAAASRTLYPATGLEVLPSSGDTRA